MERFEILIELNGFRYNLDTFQDESIQINYNIADINDISSRNSTYTKTVRIPESNLNKQIFGDIADLSVSSTFNPNKKTKCWVLVDSIVVLEGYLQLRDVIYDIDMESREYEIIIFAENDNFIKEIENLELTDLDFSELSHTYSATNIEMSWTASWNNGFYYPLIDYGYDWDYSDISGNKLTRNDVNVQDMFPATNVKYIVDKIFNDADFSYESNFFNSDIFKDLYIPFNRSGLKRDISILEDKFSIGMTGPVTITASGPFNIMYEGAPGVPQFLIDVYRVPFNNETSPYGDPDGFYNTSLYEYTADGSNTSQRFTCNFDISFYYRGINDYAFIDSNTNEPTTYICFKRSRNPITGLTVSGGVVMPVNGSTTPVPFTVEAIPGLEFFGATVTAGITESRVVGQISTDMLDNVLVDNRTLYDGEKVWVELKYSCDGNIIFALDINPDKTALKFNNKNEFFNTLNDNIIPNEFIDYNFSVIPKNIKQTDFFYSLMKMFNLYIEPSKENDRCLIIEPRDQFYEGGEIVDWSYKLDISEPLNIKILGETQNKKTIFSYKEDKDYYNVDYKDFKSGDIYGQYDYEIDNDFVVGENKVELIFSPTPLVQVPSSNKLVIPKIGKLNNNLFSPTDHNIRILTKFRSSTSSNYNYNNVSNYSSADIWNGYTLISGSVHSYSEGDCIRMGLSDVNSTKPIFKIVKIVTSTSFVINLLFSDFNGSTSGTTTTLEGMLPTDDGLEVFAFNLRKYRAYPYLGHFDNPFEPSYDLNFGQTIGLYYPEKSITNDNLYSVYWENQMLEISDLDSRIISGNFYLTPDDIASFTFNKKVFIGNQYYKVNKISYDPTRGGLSNVELIKSLVITLPREFSRSVPSIPMNDVVNNDSLSPIKEPLPIGIIVGGPRNTIKKNKNLIIGTDNASYGENVYLLGNGNIVSSNNNFITGDDNKIDHSSDENFIIGSNNEVKSGVNNSFIFGSDVTVTESDTIYIQGKLVNAPNYINAGRDEVLSPFSDSIINYISASRNAVREFGSESIINIISGGRFIL